MDIGHNGDVQLPADFLEHLETIRHAGAAEAVIGRTVCLVKGCLEYIGDAETIRNLLDAAPDHEGALQPLEDAGSRDENERLTAADFKIRQLHFVHLHGSFQRSCSSFVWGIYIHYYKDFARNGQSGVKSRYAALAAARSSSVSTPMNTASVSMTRMRCPFSSARSCSSDSESSSGVCAMRA